MEACFFIFRALLWVYAAAAAIISIGSAVYDAKHHELDWEGVRFCGGLTVFSLLTIWWTQVCAKGFASGNEMIAIFGLALFAVLITLVILLALWEKRYD